MYFYSISLPDGQEGTITLKGEHTYRPDLPMGSQFGHITVDHVLIGPSEPGYIFFLSKANITSAIAQDIAENEEFIAINERCIEEASKLLENETQHSAKALLQARADRHHAINDIGAFKENIIFLRNYEQQIMPFWPTAWLYSCTAPLGEKLL